MCDENHNSWQLSKNEEPFPIIASHFLWFLLEVGQNAV
jgi:hypothetical protein